MGVGVYAASGFLGGHLDLTRTMGRLLQVFGSILVGVVLYLGGAVLLRMDEPLFLWTAFAVRLRRRSRLARTEH